MATQGNGLLIKVYKRALTSSYLRALKDSNSNKNCLGKNQNPSRQIYIPKNKRKYFKRRIHKKNG